MDKDRYDPLMDAKDLFLASLAKKGVEHEQEKQIFTVFIDWIYERWRKAP